MGTETIEQILKQTLADSRLSRSEKSALDRLAEDWGERSGQLGLARKTAFKLAKEELSRHDERQVLEWLEAVMKVLAPVAAVEDAMGSNYKPVECRFSPGNECLDLILDCLNRARRSLDICVFTISDDRITKAILRAKSRGVAIRIITDNDKQYDLGSDVDWLEREGVPLKVDLTDGHMHHKFAIIDREWLLNGSYNWTRSAANYNMENVITMLNPEAVSAYQTEFDALWEKL